MNISFSKGGLSFAGWNLLFVFLIYAAGLLIVCSPTIDKMLKNYDYFRTNCKYKLQN